MLLDAYGYAEVLDSFIRIGELPFTDTLSALIGWEIPVIVSYHTGGGILVVAGKTVTRDNAQSPTGIRRIIYTGATLGKLPSATRAGFEFGGWSISEYSYNIEEKGAPVYLTVMARWMNEGDSNA